MNSRKQTLALAALLLGGSLVTLAQTTAITYQGSLTDGGAVANGNYEFRFAIYDSAASGVRVTNFITNAPVAVSNGRFAASMDFGTGPFFTGVERWLDIGVRTNGSAGSFSVLSPRQRITSTPHALRAAIASNADQLNGQSASAYVAAAGDTMTGTLTLPANGLHAGANQLWLSGGYVGIGTTAPSYPLHVASTAQIVEKLVTSHTAGTWLDIENTSTGGNRWGVVSTGSANGEGAGHLLLRDITDGRTVMTLKSTGDVGIGTTAPQARLHVSGGTATVLGSGGYLVLGNTTGVNLSMDNNDIQARNNGTAETLWLNAGGGNVNIMHGGPGRVGIGTSSPQAAVDVVSWENHAALRLKNPFGASLITLEEGGGNQAYVNCFWEANLNHINFQIGGAYLGLNSSGIAYASGAFVCTQLVETSDRNRKTDIEAVDAASILERVVALPLTSWAFTNALNARHIGPMAQDFHAAFGLGDDDKTLSTRDVASVGLAAIQGLNEKVECEARSAERRVNQLQAENIELRQRLAALEQQVNALVR